MKTAFTVDGISYNVFVPEKGIKRSGSVLDGDKAGRLQTGRMERDIIGTYYNYSIQVDTSRLEAEDYDALFQVLSAPVDYHTITMPYAQSVLTFEAYVSNVSDVLIQMHEDGNQWGELSFQFIAMEPARTP